jgi:RecJ-like exonuclease
MGSCIICGTSVDGRICELHEEDVVFEFRGTQPDELTPDRYYRGTVDGYAEFGVFVDIGDHVTGLLHKSELDQRLDSLDWDAGDTVFVQVKGVRDNGNIDLGWSIRQDESSFRGTLVDDPEADAEYLAEEDEAGNAHGGATDGSSPASAEREEGTDDEAGDDGATESAEPAETGVGAGNATESGESEKAEESAPRAGAVAAQTEDRPARAGSVDDRSEGAEAAAGEAETGETPAAEDGDDAESVDGTPTFEQVTIDSLADRVGERVRVEGEVVTARQTSGPTVFELRDETGTVDCAAFEEAGVRAYPEAGEGDIVRLEGEVERRRGELQVETEGLVVLEDEERDTVTERMDEAMLQRARPDEVDPLAADPAVESALEGVRDAATAVRRAVLEGRPVIVRHSATADGYLAGVALERATLPLVREHNTGADAEYHYFDRRPLEGSVYDMDDATGDVTDMLSNRARHDEQFPLFVFLAAGGTAESQDALDLLGVYGARRVLVDEQEVDADIAETVDVLATPDEGETTATALAATLAAHVNGDTREELRHLPAVSFWEETPEEYVDLAEEAGSGAEETTRMREAVALEAYYQSYEDKRELVADLLYGEGDLVEHVSEQFRERMSAEVETAEANIGTREVGGETVLVLDTDAYTHRYEFPPDRLLLDELYRRHREEAAALFGVGTDEAFVRGDVDVRTLVERAQEDAPEAGLDARGAREGRVEFLAGEREAAQEALLDALAESL